MTKQASVGAVLACHGPERPLEYVEAPKDGVQIPPQEIAFTLAGLQKPLDAALGSPA